VSDTFIDPVTRDYVLDTAHPGALARDPADGLANAVYLRLSVPLGSYWAAPKLGSLLHTLAREKATPRVADNARRFALSALQPLVDAGRISQLTVATQIQIVDDGTKRLALLIEAVDASGRPRTFEHPVKVA
jgi:phage gp46-like protein